MFSRAEQPPTPFPTRSFVAVGTCWVLLDLLVVSDLAMESFWGPSPFASWHAWGDSLLVAWSATLAAKGMLMLGWLFLGEGALGHRLAGIFLFTPVFAPFVIGAFWQPELICMLAMTGIFAVPVMFMVGLAYAVLKGADHRLARDAPASREKVGQFTVRQLMLVTLVAGVVLGLLRWAQQANLQWAVMGLQIPLLIWAFPLAMCRGLLRTRWYPDILFALGVAAFVLGLPAFTLSDEEVGGVALFVSTYVLVFAGHLLLLRGLGFRLVQYKPKFRYDPEIWFVDHEEPGIQFFERERPTASAERFPVSRDRDSGARTRV